MSTPSESPAGPSRGSAPGNPGKRWLRLLPLFLLPAALAIASLWNWQAVGRGTPVLDYSTFYSWAEQGQLESATFQGRHLVGRLRTSLPHGGRVVKDFHTELPERDDSLLPLLRAKGVRIVIDPEGQSAATQLFLNLLPWVLIIGVWIWLGRRTQGALARGGPFADLTKNKSRRFQTEPTPSVTFEHVAGLEGAKRDLREIVEFLREPKRFRRLGAKVPRGVLLVGPPGTGKTLLARAVAGESGVPFFSINASEFVEMFVGLGAARVRDLFAEAKKSAPAIVFIDEIDAVGRTRGASLGVTHDEREQTLNQLLAEMDGFSRDELIIVLAATNRPDVLDPALLRPGRFDRRVLVDRPEVGARRAILGVHAKGKPLAGDVDLQTLAENTRGFSGADLANLVNEAAINATRRGADSIAFADFAAAQDKITLGNPREGRLGAAERRHVAVHEGGHGVVAWFLPETEPLQRVSILPRGLALGMTQQGGREDQHLVTRAALRAKLAVMMGGYAAEQLEFGDVSTGAEDDLKQATELATNMVAHYGMSDRLGPVYYEHKSEQPFLGRRIAVEGATSDATIHLIEEEVRRLIADALAAATTVLERNRNILERLVAALLERETLERGELDAILGAHVLGAVPSSRTSAG